MLNNEKYFKDFTKIKISDIKTLLFWHLMAHLSLIT